MIFMVIGAISAIGGWAFDKTDHHQYWWANLLICSFFFFAISLGAMFFYAVQYAAEVAWTAQLKRIFEAMFSYIPVGLITVLIVLLAGQFHIHHIYHWMDSEVVDPNSPKFDALIANKMPFLSSWFFWLRFVIYAVTFIVFGVISFTSIDNFKTLPNPLIRYVRYASFVTTGTLLTIFE